MRPECPAEGPVKVSDLIGSRKEVFSIAEDTSVHQAAQYLREKQVRSVGVTNASGKLAGVISHSDVSDKVAAENKCPAWMKAADIMTRELVTVTPEMTMEDCLRLMEQNTIFHLLVVDAGGQYRGMLSVSDILRVVASDEKARADLLESFIFHSSCSKKISYSDVASSEEREDGSAQWPELCNVPTRRNFGRTCPRKRNGRTKALNLSICCRRKRSFLGAPPLCSK